MQHDVVVSLKHFSRNDRVICIDVVVQKSRPGGRTYVEQRGNNEENRAPSQGAAGIGVSAFV